MQEALVKAGHAVVEGGGVGASDKETGSKAGTGGTVKPGKGLEQGTVVTLVSAESAMTPMVERVQGLGAMLKVRPWRRPFLVVAATRSASSGLCLAD